MKCNNLKILRTMYDFEGILAIFMVFLIPIIAIVFSSVVIVEKKKRDKEIRQLLIEHNFDIDRAKLMLEEQERKNSKYGTLRSGLIMLGIGFGALLDFLLGITYKNVYFWLIIAVGIGIGMLTSFVVEQKLAEKAAGNCLQAGGKDEME